MEVSKEDEYEQADVDAINEVKFPAIIFYRQQVHQFMICLTVVVNNGDHFSALCLLSASVAPTCRIFKPTKTFILLVGSQRLFTTEVWWLTILKTRVICEEAIYVLTRSSALTLQWMLVTSCTSRQWIKCLHLWPLNITKNYSRFFWVRCKTCTSDRVGTSDGTTTRVRCRSKLSTSIWLKIKPAFFPAFASGLSQS